MKYSEIDLQCEDIMWFGVDKSGLIFECTSAGIGNVPEFICKSKETNEKICDFFMNSLKEKTEGILLCEEDDDNELLKDCLSLSAKGIFCYDISEDEDKEGDYIKISAPQEPINISALPDKIKSLMSDHTVDVDISAANALHVTHAY